MKNLIILTLLLHTVQAKDFIDIYASYANSTELIVSGRVVDSEDKKREEDSSKQSSTWQNFKENLGNFSYKEKKNVDLTLEVNNFSRTIKTDDEGYFFFNLHAPLTIKQTVQLYTQNKKEAREVSLFIPSAQKHIGIISDFDDTVIVSDVSNKLKLLSNTFFKNFKQREVVKGMRERFDKILKTNVHSKNNFEKTAIFFVTGSPHQLQENINAFLDLHQFPKHVLLSKKIQGENADALSSTIAYKYDKIVRLIKMYPQVTWVCFGDSGEKDRDVYLKVLKNYPQQIKVIYIRNVESKKIEEVYPNQTTLPKLKPFTTDGCSYFPDGTVKEKEAWLNCCTEHDKAYWVGGTESEKTEADKALGACVAKSGFPKIAKLMYYGVTVGGTPRVETSYKWGYGWEEPRGYFTLTEQERAYALEILGKVK